MFDKDDVVIDIGDRTIVVDKEGYKLWKKHKWNYNLSIRHLYRREVKIEGGKKKCRIILFWVELLDYPKHRTVYFGNRNNLDLREKNIIIPYI